VQFDRISINSAICHGQACVKGTRMPVHQIVRMLANGDTVEDLLREYPFLSREDIMALAQRILDSLRLASRPGTRSSSSAGSIGIAFDEPGITSEQLLRNADIAMYQAKAGGKDRFEIYRDEMHAAVLARVAQERDLRAAIHDGDLLTHYQPMYDLDTRRIVGFEALARGPAGSPWASPANLFAGATDAGRLPELDWICRSAAVRGALAADLDPRLALFVNVEPASNQTPCPDDLADIITIADRWPIVCEITERAITGDPGGLLATVEGLRHRRRHVALDDIGADPASQAIMPLLRPDVIKLDQTIIADPHGASTS